MDLKLLLFALCVVVFVNIESVSAGNKEHVHIKVHVPEIIKKHTHHRTIYKHHYKIKPKPKKSKKSHSHYRHEHDDYYDHDNDRVDPSVRHGVLPSKHQRHHWYDHQPSASHHHYSKRRPHEETSTESSIDVSSPEILSRWRQNFELLNRKPPKKSSSKKHKAHTTKAPIDISSESEEDKIPVITNGSPFENFDFNDKYFADIPGEQFDHHIFRPLIEHQEHPKYTTTYSSKDTPKHIHPSLPDPFMSPYLADLKSHEPKSSTKSEFMPPHVLKITGKDIRNRPKSTTSTATESSGISFGSDSYANWKLYEWSTEKPPTQVEHHYLRPTSSALHTMAELVSQEEFMPLKQANQYSHALGHMSVGMKQETDDGDDEVEPVMGSTQMDFGMPLAENMDPYETFTKRKNIKSGRNTMIAMN